MEALISKPDAAQPLHKKCKTSHPTAVTRAHQGSNPLDKTLNSVSKHTSIPRTLQDIVALPENAPNLKHVANKKLRRHWDQQSVQSARAKVLLEDAEMSLMGEARAWRD